MENQPQRNPRLRGEHDSRYDLQFVVCHEFGHIISGHAGSLFGSKNEIAELVSHVRVSALERDQRQAWEYDADHVAASLLISFVEELVADCAINPRTRAVFSRTDGRDFEHTLAILMASLFAFFAYVQGMRRTLNKHTAHPQPIVRAHYLRNMLFRLSAGRDRFDPDLFDKLFDQRLNEIQAGLEIIGIFGDKSVSEERVTNLEKELDRLRKLGKKHRPSCAPWAWIEWDVAV